MRNVERKTITFDKIILGIRDAEIEKRGGRTTYTALVSEALADKFALELKVSLLEEKAKSK